MIELLKALRVHAGYWQRLLGFGAAFLVADVFYKFGSFSLECVAFLATWLVFDFIIDLFFAPGAEKQSKT